MRLNTMRLNSSSRICGFIIGVRHVSTLFEPALPSGGGAHSDIVADWLSVRPFPRGEPRAEVDARLNRWCEAAYQYAQALAAMHLKA
jgi:hypothetical protein